MVTSEPEALRSGTGRGQRGDLGVSKRIGTSGTLPVAPRSQRAARQPRAFPASASMPSLQEVQAAAEECVCEEGKVRHATATKALAC